MKCLAKFKSCRVYSYARHQYGKLRLRIFAVRRRLAERVGCFRFSKVGLCGLDDKLAPYLNFRNGVFIEAGANDGVSQSNTYYLAKALGWHGVLVEAVPRLFRKCRKSRPDSKIFNCALVAPENEGAKVTIRDVGEQGLLSKIAECEAPSDDSIVATEGRTLTSVLAEAGLTRVDFFSLDVEGYELDVLRGLDLSRFQPRFILVETGQAEVIDGYLSTHYERLAQLSYHDYLYRAKDAH